MGNATASRELQRSVPRPIIVTRLTVDMVVMVVMPAVMVVMRIVMRRTVHGATDDRQAMMVPVLRHEPVQTVAQQRDAAICGAQRNRQAFTKCEFHGRC